MYEDMHVSKYKYPNATICAVQLQLKLPNPIAITG